MRVRALGLAACTVALACIGPPQLYPGSRLPDDETATIEVRHELFDPIAGPMNVVRIDGKPVTGVTWSILPGPHVIQVELDDRSPPQRRTSGRHYCKIHFEAAAGRTYDVRPEPDTTLGAWVREMETGARFPGEPCTRLLDTRTSPDR